MTVIAWDGKTLAADKQSTAGSGMRSITTKIFRVDNILVAAAGLSTTCTEMVEWVKAGRELKKFPMTQLNKETTCCTIVINEHGQIEEYHRSAIPLILEDKFYAIGSGKAYAMTAMYYGKTAVEAVEVASHFDIHCGMGVDTLELIQVNTKLTLKEWRKRRGIQEWTIASSLDLHSADYAMIENGECSKARTMKYLKLINAKWDFAGVEIIPLYNGKKVATNG